jgi:glycosyltransferase involved in cell wall biosynthesis
VYTASADIGIQPILNTCLNHYTTDSNKLFEYVLAGIPIIATDFPEIRNIVKGHQLGLLIDQSLESLVSAIKRLLEDPELREKFKSRAIKERKTLSWESQESVLLEIYKDCQ